jgi:hypothetical protein
MAGALEAVTIAPVELARPFVIVEDLPRSEIGAPAEGQPGGGPRAGAVVRPRRGRRGGGRRSAAGRGRGRPCGSPGTASPVRGPSGSAPAIPRVPGGGRGCGRRLRSSPSRTATDPTATARPLPAIPAPSSTPVLDAAPDSSTHPPPPPPSQPAPVQRSADLSLNVAATSPCHHSWTPTDPWITDPVPVSGPPPPPLTISKLRALDYPHSSAHVNTWRAGSQARRSAGSPVPAGAEAGPTADLRNRVHETLHSLASGGSAEPSPVLSSTSSDEGSSCQLP